MMARKSTPLRKSRDVALNLTTALDKSADAFISVLMDTIRSQGITSMARRTGVSRHTLYRYVWGTDRPMFETVVKLTAACGVKLIVVPDDRQLPPGDATP
jgi:probable addiction module antidote protein